MPNALARFTITPTVDGFELHMEDDSGEWLEVLATTEQLDVIFEEIDRQLDATTLDDEDLDDGGPDDDEDDG